jgi:uncharacterized protein with HEPN domain
MSFRDVPGNYLAHILLAIEHIRNHVAGMTKAEVAADRKTEAAVERELQILTEAAYKLGDDAPRLCPAEDWRKIRGLGNILRHAYEGVDIETLWRIIEFDLPHLETSIKAASGRSPESNRS